MRDIVRLGLFVLFGSGLVVIWDQFVRNGLLAASLEAGRYGAVAAFAGAAALAALCLIGAITLGRPPRARRAVRIELKDGEPIDLSGMSIALDEDVVARLMAKSAAFDRSKFAPLAEAQKQALMAELGLGAHAAAFAHHTLEAFRSGQVQKLLFDETDDDDEALMADVVAAQIAPIDERFPSFFGAVAPLEREFLLSWADRLVLTSDRLIVFSADEPPAVTHTLPFARIARYAELA